MVVSEEECVRHFAHLDRIKHNGAKIAYIALILAAERSNFRSKAKLKGAVHEVQFWRNGRQSFALIVNQREGLLFYVRGPDSEECRRRIAEAAHDLRVRSDNALGEDRYRLATYADAIRLASSAFS